MDAMRAGHTTYGSMIDSNTFEVPQLNSTSTDLSGPFQHLHDCVSPVRVDDRNTLPLTVGIVLLHVRLGRARAGCSVPRREAPAADLDQLDLHHEMRSYPSVVVPWPFVDRCEALSKKQSS